MRAWAIAAGGAVAIAIALILTSGQSPSEQVEAKVQELAHAMAHRDYATICRDVLARPLVTRLSLYGAPCSQTLSLALHAVRNPVVSIGRVTINGPYASVVTLTVATGQRAALSRIELLDTDNGWRITSLASPLTPPRRP